VTCPHCHRVQEGPEGVRRLVEKQTNRTAPVVTKLKIVATNGAHKTQPKPAAKAAPKPTPKATAPPPPAPKKDLLSRALGF
jgi:hypothetical protein